MKYLLVSAFSILLVTGCGASDPNVKPSSANQSSPASSTKSSAKPVSAATAVVIESVIPYKKGVVIASNIRNECSLGEQLSEFVRASASDEGISVIRKSNVNAKRKGQTLVLSITNAVSQGNAWIGHRKFTSVEGTLYKNGKKQSSFTAARFSGGGFFGGFKGSCSVLGRTVKAIGEDVGRWLKKPFDGVHLGDSM